jgi:hypothetical protein
MSTPPPSFHSKIISDFPEIFEEFQGQHFTMLWRDSRHGFEYSAFHDRCDNHTNTLTFILDTDGNIFGGFTPVKWESVFWNRKYGTNDNRKKTDESLKSFLFTVKNPHNIPARRFPLKPEKKYQAICCHSGRKCFGYGSDLVVSDHSEAST